MTCTACKQTCWLAEACQKCSFLLHNVPFDLAVPEQAFTHTRLVTCSNMSEHLFWCKAASDACKERMSSKQVLHVCRLDVAMVHPDCRHMELAVMTLLINTVLLCLIGTAGQHVYLPPFHQCLLCMNKDTRWETFFVYPLTLRGVCHGCRMPASDAIIVSAVPRLLSVCFYKLTLSGVSRLLPVCF